MATATIDITGIFTDLGPRIRPSNEKPPPLDPKTLFEDDHPIELEIGSGKGLFLVRESERQPDVNFLGIEWARKYAKLAATRLAKHGVENVRILSADARTLIRRFPDDSFRAVHLYFPDPWWKRRQEKRRIIVPEFIDQLARVLVAGGGLRLATDVEEYHLVMLGVLGQSDEFLRSADPEPIAPRDDLDYLTHFERKYRKEGRSIHRAEYRRREKV